MSEETREARLNGAFVTLADTLIADYDIVDLLHTLVEECTELLDTQAGGLLLADSTGTLHLAASTSEQAEFVEIMQLDAGTGPCVECYTTGRPVVVADIAEEAALWPEFQAAALRQGYHSVHATPMRLRGHVIGAMNLFSTSARALNDRDASVAQALADVATIGILQERLIRGSDIVTEQLQRALDSRILIEQAKGVLAQSGDIGMDEAFAVLRTYARRHSVPLRSVAEEVINGTVDVFVPSSSTAPATTIS